MTQLDDNLKAVDVALTADDLKALDEVSKLAPEYPGSGWTSLGAGPAAGREEVLIRDWD